VVWDTFLPSNKTENMFGKLSQRLYIRIWLTVVGLLLLVAVASAVGWRAYMEHERIEYQANPPILPARELQVRDASGDVIAFAESKAGRRPGSGLEFELAMPDGQQLQVIIPPRPRTPQGEAGLRPPGQRPPLGGPPPPGVFDWRWLPRWIQPPYSFLWLLLIVSVAIALGAYPVARKLTQRIERLRDGVRKFGDGDLSARVEVRGRDEVGYLAQQFNASAQRVQQLIEAQKSLLANASHELRSPLARIRMGMEMLPASNATLNESKIRQEIHHSIRELDELIEEILLSSKLDALKSGKSVDLGKQEAVDLIGLCAEECARVGAELQLAEGMQTLQVHGHHKLLVRMVRNLLENARRYSNGQIELSLGTLDAPGNGKEAQIRICDHGVGVPESQRVRIFEPFYRLPGASEREGGVGLGLALVKSIALQHRGIVVCESRPDGEKGACFLVTLPHV
jgi:two-component system, OmpR family, sensor kinase